tara:strand:- start:397 stop:687 length:291 start_codon:yes stop_codon:yes gene_type:complete
MSDWQNFVTTAFTMLAREKERHDNPAEFTERARDLARYVVVVAVAGLAEIGAVHDGDAIWEANKDESQTVKDFLKECYLDYSRLSELADEEEQGSS